MGRMFASLIMPGALVFALAASPVLGQSKLGKQKRSGPVKWPECYCTDRYGKRHEMGDIICLTVGGRSFEAKCVMAQNNPFWRDQKRGCSIGSLPMQKMTPFPWQNSSQVAFNTE